MCKSKRLFLVLVVLLALTAVTAVVFAAPLVNSSNRTALNKEQRLEALFSAKILEMEYDYAQRHDNINSPQLAVDDIKTLHGFADSTYTLAELEPSGYIIIHNESGVFMEDSVTSYSPYVGLENDLYYAGVTGYYFRDGDEYHHTVLENEVFDINNDAEGLENAAMRLDAVLMNNVDTEVEAFLNGKSAVFPGSVGGFDVSYDVQSGAVSTLRTVNYQGYTCIDDYLFFTLLNEVGDNDDGTCGYLAAGMLLAWNQFVYGGNYISSGILTVAAGPVLNINDSLHQELVSIGHGLGYGDGTMAISVRDTVEEYLSDRNIDVTHHTVIPANNIGINGHLNNNRPVIWFGLITAASSIYGTPIPDLPMVSAHAVVIYGRKTVALIGTSYICHFGWQGWNEVTFNGLGIIGSYYTFS